jgi:hypothetical protein
VVVLLRPFFITGVQIMKRSLWLLMGPLWCAGCGSASGPDGALELPLYSSLSAAGASAAVPAAGAPAAGAPAPPPCKDSDDDKLCDDEEIMLGTNPQNRDTDGDALDDGLEVKGYTLNNRTLDLKALGANPRRKDIFLEIHYMKGWQPLPEAVDDVKAAFLAAPVTNHDGSRGIQLHAEVTKEIPLIDTMAENPQAEVLAMKNAYLDELRPIAFHYGIFGNRYGKGGSSGSAMTIGSAEFVVTLGGHEKNTSTTPRQKQAGTLMHELGHNLGLHHGGQATSGAHSDTPWQPNYISTMNYTYQFTGVPRSGVGTLDYARSPVRALTESSLDEVAAFSVNKATPDPELLLIKNPVICTKRTGSGWQSRCDALLMLTGTAGSNLDLNRSKGTIQTTAVGADLDGDGRSTTTHAGLREEWNALDYKGGGIIGNRNRLRRRDVVTEEPVFCQGPLDVVVATSESDPTQPQEPQEPPLPEQEPQAPEEPAPPEEEPQWPEEPAPPEEEPQWPEEPARPEEEPQWPEEPVPPEEPEDEPQWPEEPEDPEP